MGIKYGRCSSHWLTKVSNYMMSFLRTGTSRKWSRAKLRNRGQFLGRCESHTCMRVERLCHVSALRNFIYFHWDTEISLWILHYIVE